MWRPTMPAYFASLRVAANSAAAPAPASRAASVTNMQVSIDESQASWRGANKHPIMKYFVGRGMFYKLNKPFDFSAGIDHDPYLLMENN